MLTPIFPYFILLTLGGFTLVGCGSDTSPSTQTNSPPGATDDDDDSMMSTNTGGASSDENPDSTEPMASSTNGGTSDPPNDVSNDKPDASATTDQDGSTDPMTLEPEAYCSSVAEAGSCDACVCEQCYDTITACASTPGCGEILACGDESGCEEAECFCGDVSLLECLAGQGNGPCKEVILAAPGGRQPTLENPSGGPASDAAFGVAACAASTTACEVVCQADAE